MKNEKGITLVALILIILLLLVLAGVTVALVLSNESEAPATTPGTSVVDTPNVEDTVTSENDIETDAEGDAAENVVTDPEPVVEQ